MFNLTSSQALHEDVVSHKPMLDRLTDRSEEVLRYSADHSVSSDRMQLATRYQALLAASKVRIRYIK